MANPNLAQLVADAWELTLRESPDPFDIPWIGECKTYQERLDRQPRNCYGDLIPRIVTVRRNLRQTKGYRATW